MEKQRWNNPKIQTHWNKIQYVNSKVTLKERITFVFLIGFVLKDNKKSAHQVGDLKLKLLNLEAFYKRKRIINRIEASLIGVSFKH